MNREECLRCMKTPAEARNPLFHSIIQIVVTSCCDRACSNCTYMVKHRRPEHITVENFRRAIESLAFYPGVIGLIGGNPCLHPKFGDLCQIMMDAIPDKNKRGLWTNRLFGYGELCRETFGFFNLNVHGDRVAATEMERSLPGVHIFGRNRPSIHGAVMVSLEDIIPDAKERRIRISQCDINQNWSASIVQIEGKLGGYFCEVASSLAAVDGDHSHGLAIEPYWWNRPMETFGGQVDRFCHRCGVPLRIRGHADVDETDDISAQYEHVRRHHPRRTFVVHSTTEDLVTAEELTDYHRLRTT